MRQLADLVGAVRLPTGAHRRAAGTDALTDLLILRRREPHTPPAEGDWELTREIDVNRSQVRINAYLAAHPQRILGELAVGHGMYDGQTLLVRPHGSLDLPARRAARRCLGRSSRRRARTDWHSRPGARLAAGSRTPAPATCRGRPPILPRASGTGTSSRTSDGSFTAITRRASTSHSKSPKSHRLELRALLELRDSTRRLLGAEAASAEDTEQIAELRAQLRDRYGAYAARYGPINRFTLRRTGAPRPRHRRGADGPRHPARGPALSLRPVRGARHGARDLRRRLPHRNTGRDPRRARRLTAGTAARRRQPPGRARDLPRHPRPRRSRTRSHGCSASNPPTPGHSSQSSSTTTPSLRARASGRVPLRQRPRESSTSPGGQPSRTQHSTPTSKPSSGCSRASSPPRRSSRGSAPRGSTATPTASSSQSCSRTHRSRSSTPAARSGRSRATDHSVKATSEWGTSRMPGARAGEGDPRATPDPGHRRDRRRRAHPRVVNPTETAAAQEKAHAMQERFAEWCWEDPDRARRLAGEYNRRFNSLVLRDYTTDGRAAHAPRPRAHVHARARISAPPSPGCSPSPPSGCFTRSAPARPPRW